MSFDSVNEVLVQECLNKRGLRNSVNGFQFAFELVCLMVQAHSFTVKKEIKEKMIQRYPELDYAHIRNSIRYALKSSGINMTVRDFLTAVYQDVQKETCNYK